MPSYSAQSREYGGPLALILALLVAGGAGFGVASWAPWRAGAASAEPAPQQESAAQQSATSQPADCYEQERKIVRLEGEVEDLKLALANTKADLKELTDARVVEGQREEEAAPQAVPPGVLLIQPRVEIAPQRPGTITRQPTGRPRLANLLGPTVHNLGDQLLVTGSVHNIGTADARQTLVVTLYGDGEELDFQDLWIELAPGGEQNYTFQFSRRGSSTTSYSAKATFE